jgi:hypothetical protein
MLRASERDSGREKRIRDELLLLQLPERPGTGVTDQLTLPAKPLARSEELETTMREGGRTN